MAAPPLTYLDHNASTQVDSRVVQAMLRLMRDEYGNPSSSHRFGAAVAGQIEEARQAVARRIGASAAEVIFTSGGTEADNAAIHGILLAAPSKRHLICSSVEHHAVREQAAELQRQGFEVDWMSVDGRGQPDLRQLESLLRPDTALVAVMLANNETGILLPVREVAQVAHSRDVPVFCDAVNALGKTAVDVRELGVDMLAISGHKIHGPKGVGALYLRAGTPWRPLLIGGPQERHRRGGTHNAPGIVGLGIACEILGGLEVEACGRMERLRELLESGLRRACPDVVIIGQDTLRVPNTTCACFPGCNAEAILMALSEQNICASSGAACASGALEPSSVLKAMGIRPDVARGQVRFSLGRDNTEADVERLQGVLPGILSKAMALGL